MLNLEHSLIAYFSYSGNTKALAEQVAQQTGATFTRIQSKPPYSANYGAAVTKVLQQNRKHDFPKIEDLEVDIRKYQVLLLGFPIWDTRLPPPVRTFVRDHDCSGRFIVPFFMHSGFGGGKSIDEIKEYCSRSTILPPFSTTNSSRSGNETKIRTWLESVSQEVQKKN